MNKYEKKISESLKKTVDNNNPNVWESVKNKAEQGIKSSGADERQIIFKIPEKKNFSKPKSRLIYKIAAGVCSFAIVIAMTFMIANIARDGKPDNFIPGESESPGESEPPEDVLTGEKYNLKILGFSDYGDPDKSMLEDAWNSFIELCKTEGEALNEKYGDVVDELSLDIENGGSMAALDENNQLDFYRNEILEESPDLIRIDNQASSVLGQKGYLLDLKTRFNVEDIKNLYVENAWNAMTYKDSLYAIPFDAYTFIWSGNSEALTEIGKSLPKNYDELLETGTALKNNNNVSYPYTIPLGPDARITWPTMFFASYLWRSGGDILNEDLTEAVFNSEEGVSAINKILELRDMELVNKEAYEEGTSDIYDAGTWRLHAFYEKMFFDLLPELEEGVERYSAIGGYGLSVVKSSVNSELAYDFSVHLSTGKNTSTGNYYQYDFAVGHAMLPTLIAAGEFEEYSESSENYDTVESYNVEKSFWDTCIEQLKISKNMPNVISYQEINAEIKKALDLIITEGKDPQKTLDESAEAVNELLSANK